MEEGPSATSSIMLVSSSAIDPVADTQWGNSLGPVDFREAYPTGHSDQEANQPAIDLMNTAFATHDSWYVFSLATH
jgi:hypothetical protein